MTVFVLVPGWFTGAWVWEETAARLAEAGAEARPVALTGLDGPPGAGGVGGAAGAAGVDLDTHIADVLAVIDSVGAGADGSGGASGSGREIVLVGHDYGIHPALGAAARRVGRVARVVYLDAGMPRDGVPALAAVPDPALREGLAARGTEGGDGFEGVLPPPGRDEWPRWGSTAGVPDAALDRLTTRAAPQPLGTLLQPLRLAAAVASVPATGVLCTGNGAGLGMLQLQVDFGDPALGALADAGVPFFELPTGHWPMLSCPADLARVLVRAAAGEGHQLVPFDAARPPAHLRPFPLDVPERARERTGHVDLYPPDAEGPRPAVLFVHGGPLPAGARPGPRDWPLFQGYAGYAAARGVVAATVEHGLHAVTDYPAAADDVAAAVERVRADPRVDPDRVALWFFSGGGPLAAEWLSAPPPWLRCLAATYPILAPLPNWGLPGGRFRPAEAVAGAGELPVVLTRVGLELPEIAATVEEFLTAARAAGTDVEVIDVPHGHHGFETLDLTEEARAAVRRATRAVLGHLTG
ncbi:alpha/beta hydrolase family protein [Streptomyces sp. NPDC090994]|uniref:alpha/beta hydrolase family protein n=1 Tax=Streptomyces sp. NPDC090994 TaxID=3365969 RepID=UPI003823C410